MIKCFFQRKTIDSQWNEGQELVKQAFNGLSSISMKLSSFYQSRQGKAISALFANYLRRSKIGIFLFDFASFGRRAKLLPIFGDPFSNVNVVSVKLGNPNLDSASPKGISLVRLIKIRPKPCSPSSLQLR